MIRRLLGAALVTGLLLAPGPAQAVDETSGTPGFCPDDTGTTVVIDFQEIGGDVLVRCAPATADGSGRTGLEVLQDAGIEVAGVQRWGLAFVCRIEGLPAAGQELGVTGDEDYREACIDTPPSTAYWSYWHAPHGGEWEYSQWGIKNREAVPGGFEGWSFSLNAQADDNPEPRIAPVRPGQEPDQAPVQEPTVPPSDDLDEEAPEVGDDAGTPPDDPAAEPSPERDLPPPLPRTGAEAPAESPAQSPAETPAGSAGEPDDGATEGEVDGVAWTGGEDRADADDGTGLGPAAVIAGGVVVLLLGSSVITARRRRTAP